jgi:hypothetical protein
MLWVCCPIDNLDRARLRSLVPRFLREPDLGADGESVESVVQHAGAVEIDLPSLGGLQESETLLRMQPRNAGVGRSNCALHVATSQASEVLELAPQLVEGLGSRQVDVLVRQVREEIP